MSSNTTPPPGPETPPKTPQVRIAPSHSDTPRTRPKGSNVDKGLSTAREEVYAEVDPPREVPIEFFFEHLLPETLPLAESKKIVTKMKKKSRRTPTNSPLATQEGRLSAFLKDPGDMGLCENDAYSSIPDILHGIFELVKEAHEDFSPKTHFKFTPNQPIPSDLGYTGKPDGAMFLNSEFCFTPDFQWLNVVGVGQWKLQSKDSAENLKQLFQDMNQLMLCDPRRRFVFGLTIINTVMRICFVSRTHIFMSTGFNFISDLATLVRATCALSGGFIDSSKSIIPLGFDLTVEPIRIDDGIQYIYRLGKKRYITERCLDHMRANSMIGLGCRVWLVKEYSNSLTEGHSADLYVLKDSWIEETADTEASIIHDICDDVKNARSAEDAPPFPSDISQVLEHLPTVVASEFVKVGKDADDHTWNVMVGATVEQPTRVFECQIEPTPVRRSASSRVATAGSLPSRSNHVQAPSKAELVIARKHFRILLGVSGVLLHDVEEADEFVQLAAQCIPVVQSMHAAGWLHRDVSTNSIIVQNGAAKFINFQYATRNIRRIQPSRKTPQPCMAEFLAVEAADFKYKFASRSWGRFQYSPLHDLEPFFWFVVYALLRRPISGSAEYPEFYALTDALFLNPDVHVRTDILQGERLLAPLTGHGTINRPPLLVKAIQAVEPAHSLLLRAYQTVEKHLPGYVDVAPYCGNATLYNSFLRSLEAVRIELVSLKSSFEPLIDQREYVKESTEEGGPGHGKRKARDSDHPLTPAKKRAKQKRLPTERQTRGEHKKRIMYSLPDTW